MKKLLLPGIILISILSFNSCSDEPIELPPKYITIDGERYEMSVALLDDWGTNTDITYRMYKVSFRNSQVDPSTYLNFVIYSNSTTRIQEGVYDYSYSIRKGVISFVEIGKDIVYDDSGSAISGEVFRELNSTFEGSVTIDMNNEDYDFTFDITAYKGDDTYSISGQYNAPLTLN